MQRLLRLIVALTVVLLTAALIAAPTAEDGGTATPELIRQGEVQLAGHDIDGAIATFDAAVAANPDSPLARTRLGGAYLLGQRYTDAIDQFQQAIALDADNAGAFIGMGMAYLHGSQSGPARAAFDEAKRLDPTKSADLDALLRRLALNAAAEHPHHGR